MRSLIYSIICACGIGYVFGVVFATRSITMSQLESSLGDMILLSGWVGLTFSILFIPAGLMIMVPEMLLESEADTKGFATVHNISTMALVAHIIGRSGAWACITTGV